MNKKLETYLDKKNKLDVLQSNLLYGLLEEINQMKESDKKECIKYLYYYDICNTDVIKEKAHIKGNLNTYCGDAVIKAICVKCKKVKPFYVTSKQQIKSMGRRRMCDECKKIEEQERNLLIEKSKKALDIENKIKSDELKKLQTMNYNDYLNTPHWKKFRKRALSYFKNSCQMCGKKENLHVHHNNYKNRGKESYNDVIILCKECHEKFHKIK